MAKESDQDLPRLIVSSSPHIHSGESVPRIMYSVIVALAPAAVLSVLLFGLPALRTLALCVAGCLVVEAACQRLFGREIMVRDGSAALTGLLLALNLPADVPFWLPLTGALAAIALGKQVYGGLGHNVFNPALVARVFLLISFPAHMTSWPRARAPWGAGTVDAVTTATPLGALKEELLLRGHLGELPEFDSLRLLVGDIPGSMGEMSVLALLLGAVYLLYKGYITWHTPVAFIGTVAALTGVMHLIDPGRYADPLFHVLAGGLILGAFFMATDMVTTPVTGPGMLIFGAGCGIITAVIRLWGGYPEGVSFAILIMNAATPLIDRWVKVRKFGYVRAHVEKAAGK